MSVLAHAIEESTDIFGISGEGGLNTPNPPSVRHWFQVLSSFYQVWLVQSTSCVVTHNSVLSVEYEKKSVRNPRTTIKWMLKNL